MGDGECRNFSAYSGSGGFLLVAMVIMGTLCGKTIPVERYGIIPVLDLVVGAK